MATDRSLLLYAVAPLMMHVLDKIFDVVPIVGERKIADEINKDPREFVSKPFNDEEQLLPAVNNYFKVEKSFHFILSVTLFCVITFIISYIEGGIAPQYVIFSILILFVFTVLCLLHIIRTGLRPWLRWCPVDFWKVGAYMMLFATAFMVLLGSK